MDTVDYTEFKPSNYLEEFYSGSDVGDENLFILKFYHQFFGGCEKNLKMLDLGGGPCIYQDISASGNAEEIIFSEYLESNCNEVRDWLDGALSAFDWSVYFSIVAKWEKKKMEDLEARVRERIKAVIHCDLMKDLVLEDEKYNGYFDLAISAFCVEGVTADKKEFNKFFPRIRKLMKDGGQFIGTVVRNCRGCKVCGQDFVVTPLTEMDLQSALLEGGFKDVELDVMETDTTHGYDAIMAFRCSCD